MPDLTGPFGKAFDAIRRVTQAQRAADTPGQLALLRLIDNAGNDVAAITDGWFVDEVVQEQLGGRVVELHVTDRDGVEFLDAVFFEFGGYRYERQLDANPPVNNPREWIWYLRAVGRAEQ